MLKKLNHQSNITLIWYSKNRTLGFAKVKKFNYDRYKRIIVKIIGPHQAKKEIFVMVFMGNFFNFMFLVFGKIMI